MFCSETCRNEGCPNIISGHTCSKIRFCYEADSGSDVWLMPNEMAISQCDFTEATQVCGSGDGSGDDCCNFNVEADSDLKLYLFASKAGCAEGQKAAVEIDDFDEVGDACYDMGLTSSRIKKCTCNFEDSEMSTLSEPCHSQFIAGCNHHSPELGDDTSCCDAGSCIGKHKDYSHPIGKALEDDRKKLCLDNVPGRCLHSLDKTDDCCNTKCTGCGTDSDAYFEWAVCTSGNATLGNGGCGYGGHGGRFSTYECDFTKCAKGDDWHMSGDLYTNWISTVDSDGYLKMNSEAPTPTPATKAPTMPTEKTPSGNSGVSMIGEEEEKDGGLSTGGVVGIVLGSIGGVGLIAGLVLYMRNNNQSQGGRDHFNDQA